MPILSAVAAGFLLFAALLPGGSPVGSAVCGGLALINALMALIAERSR